MNIKLLVGLLMLVLAKRIGKILLVLGLTVMFVFLGIILLYGLAKMPLLGATVGVFIACVGSRLM